MRIDQKAVSGEAFSVIGTVQAFFAVLIVGSFLSCASLKNPPGTVTAQFVQNPDRVWEGIELTLESLDYVVESSNRDEGVIRAAKPADDENPWVALEINQVMHTQDQVNVYVLGVPEDPSVTPDRQTLEKAAQDFVSVLKRKLGN